VRISIYYIYIYSSRIQVVKKAQYHGRVRVREFAGCKERGKCRASRGRREVFRCVGQQRLLEKAVSSVR